MKDRDIIELFWQRLPQAVDAVEEAYGSQLRGLAGNLLPDPQDAEECLNDAYLGLWDSIPPARPQPLLPYALRVVRNLCLKRYHYNRAGKRNNQMEVALSELENCLAGSSTPEREQDAKELGAALNGFVKGLSHRDRVLFLGRYWYGSSYKELALKLGITENNAAVRLSRLRDKLRAHLQKKGVLE